MSLEASIIDLPVQLGEWVKPFQNYNLLPYRRKESYYHQKVFQIQVNDRAISDMEVAWNLEQPTFSEPKQIFYFDGRKEKEMAITDLKRQEQHDEIRIVGIERWQPLLRANKIGIPLFLRFPSGLVLHQKPETIWGDLNSEHEFFEVKVAESDYALSQVEVMFKQVQF